MPSCGACARLPCRRLTCCWASGGRALRQLEPPQLMVSACRDYAATPETEQACECDIRSPMVDRGRDLGRNDTVHRNYEQAARRHAVRGMCRGERRAAVGASEQPIWHSHRRVATAVAAPWCLARQGDWLSVCGVRVCARAKRCWLWCSYRRREHEPRPFEWRRPPPRAEGEPPHVILPICGR